MDEIKGIRIVSLTGEKEYGIEDSEVREELANVVDGAPEELDSFKEAFEKFKEGGEALAGIAAEVAAVGKAVADETYRAEQAEQTLDDKIAVEVDKIKNGDTIVGQAREIHSRNGKTVTDSFLARTTAGSGTIGDGVASLKSVGGNIVKNLATLANFKEYNSNIVKDADIYKVTRVGTNFGIIVPGFKGVASHKYYTSYYVKGDVGKYALYLGDNVSSSETIGEVWVLKSAVITYNGSGKYLLLSSTDVNVNEFFVAKTINIDLTEMFSAGKEPDKATCDKLFGTMDALPQGLSIAKPTEFKSTGFNQFNPENVLEGKAIANNAIVPGDKKIAVIPCLPCKVGVGENNGYCIHGEFGEDIKVYLTPLNPKEVDGELYMHELTKDATTDTYVPLIKGYLLVEVPTIANLCAHFLWSEDKCERDTYEPYFESKVELPTIPQMSEWGLAGVINVEGSLTQDIIDLEKMVYTKTIMRVDDMSNIPWYKGTDSLYYSGIIPSAAKATSAIYSDAPYRIGFEAEGCMTIPTEGRLYLWDSTISTVAELKTKLAGKVMYVALATPEEYPLPKVDNNYISSDYGVEQFDSVVPCNANNLYYMRSLAGETRNFLDRMYYNTAKSDAKEVADYITNGIEGNKELATNAPNLALRALFVAAGAEYNDTDQILKKTAPWETEETWVKNTDGTYTYSEVPATVEHLPKHYYLNGLGDITEEEMVEIYSNTFQDMHANDITKYYRSQTFRYKFRTNLRSMGDFTGIGRDGKLYLESAFYANAAVEVVVLNFQKIKLDVVGAYNAFTFADSLKHVIGFLKESSTSTNLSIPALRSINLITSRNVDLTKAILIYKRSILYMIQNATPTSAVTITLHPDAYARISNQPDILEALEAQPLVTLVSA